MESKLKMMREQRGMTQQTTADISGVGLRNIRSYEQETRDINGAKLSTLLKLCLALGCRLEEIVDDAETVELLRRYEKM